MTLKLRSISLREIQMPLLEPFRISSGTASLRRILLLETMDVDGVTAWSECVAGEKPYYSPETVDTAWLAIKQWIAPRVLNKPISSPSIIHQDLDTSLRGHRMAKAAVEMSIWGLTAERERVSLVSLIGGSRHKVATGISIGIQKTPQQLLEKIREALGKGYRKVKVKVQPGADLDYLESVRAALGQDAPLMADANSAYTTADFDHLTKFDQFNLMMIEQPLACDDLVRHADLQRQLTTPLCLDESITDVDRADDMLRLGSGRIVNIKAGRVGGLATAQAIHDRCASAGVPVWCGGMLESGIGRAYNVALASLPNFTLPGDISPSSRYWKQDIVSPEWTMDTAGLLTVPHESPGIGVAVDRDYVDSLTVRSEILTAD